MKKTYLCLMAVCITGISYSQTGIKLEEVKQHIGLTLRIEAAGPIRAGRLLVVLSSGPGQAERPRRAIRSVCRSASRWNISPNWARSKPGPPNLPLSKDASDSRSAATR